MHQDTTLPCDDRGLAYGDGVFETVLVQQGQPTLWAWHCARLMKGCYCLGFEPPSQALLDHQLDGLPANGSHVLKLIVTRGSGGRGYCPPTTVAPRIIRRLVPFVARTEYWSAGVTVRLCQLTMASQPRLAGIKHLNRLENVLARQEWQTPDIAEGLLCNARREVIEATAMNVVWWQDGRWFTPPTDECGVAGTLSAALTDAGLLSTAPLTLDALPAVRHLGLLNSVQGFWPVAQLLASNGRWMASYAINTGDVRTLQQHAHALLGYRTRHSKQ